MKVSQKLYAYYYDKFKFELFLLNVYQNRRRHVEV